MHIRVLLIDAAPPVRPDDYFYRTMHDRSTDRSADQPDGPVRFESASAYFDRLVNCAGSKQTPPIAIEEDALAEFQRQGLFLTYAVECPVENLSGLSSVLKQALPNLLKRVELSYKPKFIALLSRDLGELVPALQSAWGDRLILDGDSPFTSTEWEASGVSAGPKLEFGRSPGRCDQAPPLNVPDCTICQRSPGMKLALLVAVVGKAKRFGNSNGDYAKISNRPSDPTEE